MSTHDGYLSDESVSPHAHDTESFRSQFTYRDLKELGRGSTTTPLRVITLIDFDCFYAQCETVRLGLPRERPLAVQQWKAIIALNYAAKAAGLKRGMPAEAAKSQCPDLVLQHVATWREGSDTWAYRADVNEHLKTDKAALDPYRQQSRKAFDLVKSQLPPPPAQRVEKAGIDEVFCDLSMQVYDILFDRYPELEATRKDETLDLDSRLPLPLTSLLNWRTSKLVNTNSLNEEALPADWDDVALHIASEIVSHLREQIYQHLKYTCSAGIARNKSLAKLAAGHNKPNQQTVVRTRDIHTFLSTYKFTKIRGLAGKLGQEVVVAFNTAEVTDLRRISLQELCSKIGASSGKWVYQVIRGHDYSEVVERTALQSMLSAKTFVPRLTSLAQAEKWLRIFAGDLMGRLNEENAATTSRRPKVIAFHHHIDGRFGPTRSKQMGIPLSADINSELLFTLQKTLLVQLCEEGPSWPCLGLSVSVSDFEDLDRGNKRLTSFFTTKDVEIPPEKISKQAVLPFQERQTATSGQPHRNKRRLSKFEIPNDAPYANSSTNQCTTSIDSSVKRAKSSVSTSIAPLNEFSNQEETLDRPDLYDCPNCNEQIPATDVLEHLDWHVALDFQQTET